jgi:alcohol dehydrogenase class IV
MESDGVTAAIAAVVAAQTELDNIEVSARPLCCEISRKVCREYKILKKQYNALTKPPPTEVRKHKGDRASVYKLECDLRAAYSAVSDAIIARTCTQQLLDNIATLQHRLKIAEKQYELDMEEFWIWHTAWVTRYQAQCKELQEKNASAIDEVEKLLREIRILDDIDDIDIDSDSDNVNDIEWRVMRMTADAKNKLRTAQIALYNSYITPIT